MSTLSHIVYTFFFSDTATTEIYTLSLHDALPISLVALAVLAGTFVVLAAPASADSATDEATLRSKFADGSVSSITIDFEDRKSTRLNSSHSSISYAVFCLKKKKKKIYNECLDI